MAKLTWSGSNEWKDDDGEWKEPVPVTLDMDMIEADFSKKGLGASGAIILAAFMERKSFQDNGALASLDISNNNLTQGEQYGTDYHGDPKYKTDMSGVIALSEALQK